MRGPGPNVRIAKFTDPMTRQFIGYTLDGVYGRNDRTIWMDGRPHPPDYAEYTWDGFSTGRCERGMLVVTTTHMKYGYHRRNGVPASVKSKMTEYFIRHGTELTIMQFTEDPVYLEEVLARTTDFQLNPGAERRRARASASRSPTRSPRGPKGYVPHWPFGTEHREFADTLGIPYESTQGYKEAMYPEYLPKLRKLMARDAGEAGRQVGDERCARIPSIEARRRPPSWRRRAGSPARRDRRGAASAAAACRRSACRSRAAQRPPAAGEVGVLPVQGNVYLLNLGDVNIVAQVGDDGILLVDSGPAEWSERIAQTLRDRFGDRPLRYIINTHMHPDHTGGNAALVKASAAGWRRAVAAAAAAAAAPRASSRTRTRSTA